MKLKKAPRYLALSLLTSGASLILGFLSFSGMLAIWPILPAAFAAFGLSVAYEGEIYLQNIKGAWNKLFKTNHLERQLANQYLLEKMSNTPREEYPAFFKDYEAQLLLFHQLSHHRLSKTAMARKEQVEKTLRDMEKWFALQLFTRRRKEDAELSPYELELFAWLEQHDQAQSFALLKKRRLMFHLALAFSALSAVFMSLGTTYLLVEAFSIIPMVAGVSFALWPFFIIPMAIVAGTAYGFLTYNALTDMIANDTVRKWFNNIRSLSKEPMSFRKIAIPAATIVLIALAIALTICTAGTWWTVAKEARPLFQWMTKLPVLILTGVINPIISAFSSMVFIFQNTSETLELFFNNSKNLGRKISTYFKGFFKSIAEDFQQLRSKENTWQIINPARFILKICLLPMKFILFLGHLVGIGVTSDRVPGVPHTASASAGATSEFFEDWHYFFGHAHTHTKEEPHGHQHEHDSHQALIEKDITHREEMKEILEERLGSHGGHNHDVDLPTRFLKFIFLPLTFLSTCWDLAFSKLNGNQVDQPQKIETLAQAWEKHNDIEPMTHVPLPSHEQQPSSSWKMIHTIYRIERFKEKQLNPKSQQAECGALTDEQNRLRQDLNQLNQEQKQVSRSWRYDGANFFNLKENKEPKIHDFINKTLPDRVNARVRVMGPIKDI